MKREQLDLELALPSDAGTCDACIERLLEVLASRPGIARAHVDRRGPGAPRLCLHYQPEAVGLDEIEALVRSKGAELRARYKHLSLPAAGLRHERQARLVEGVLARVDGVLHASVAFGSRQVYVEFDPSRTGREALLDALTRAGIASAGEPGPRSAAVEAREEPEHRHGGPFGERSELVFSLACGALAGAGWAIERAGAPTPLALATFVLAYGLGSWFTLQEVAIALRARKFEIDFLMLLAAGGAAALGEWFEGALLLFLFTLGHALEGYAMGRARRAVESLARLAPETASRLDEAGVEEEVPAVELVGGDRVLVRPNTRIPADGFVGAGQGSVNQAPITGESIPVDKRPVPDVDAALRSTEDLEPEHRVFAGTVNGPSALTVVVTRAAGETTLARVVKLVTEAEAHKSPTQLFTDRFERIFVPVVLLLVTALLFAWVIVDEPFTASFYRAMAVLVAASPCALAIATPSAVLSGVARAARSGVIVKGGAHLESLGAVRAVAFDKTGTLTEGRPRLTDAVPCEGATVEELLATAAAVERQSDHPLAKAVVLGAQARFPGVALPEATAVEALVGHGVRASLRGVEIVIGKPALFEPGGGLPPEVAAAVDAIQAEGRTVMLVRSGSRYLGVLGVMDTPRDDAAAVVAELHRLGVERTVMLTGDNQRVADAVARRVGIREARGDLLPEQKVAAVAELSRSSGSVAMVGDGVNDAPAMASATVGVAMGAGGSDVALETADVALMADDLTELPFAVGLSRAARAIILQNLWISLGMVALLLPATILGVAGIGAAVALHEGSTVVVVANALRLLAHGDRRNRA